jgi:hypothetical protein
VIQIRWLAKIFITGSLHKDFHALIVLHSIILGCYSPKLQRRRRTKRELSLTENCTVHKGSLSLRKAVVIIIFIRKLKKIIGIKIEI